MKNISATKFLLNSVTDITKNLSVALKFSALYFIVYIAILVFFAFDNGLLGAQGEIKEVLAIRVSFVPFLLQFSVPFIIISMAISWHRYILLGEISNKFFQFNKSYLFTAICIIAVDFGLFVGWALLLDNFLFNTNDSIAVIFTAFLTIFLMHYFSVRLSLRLPSIAIGKKISFDESVKKTSNSSWFITKIFFALLLYFGAFLPVFLLLTNIVLPFFIATGVVFSVIIILVFLIFSWFHIMLGISILTNFYKYYMQGQN